MRKIILVGFAAVVGIAAVPVGDYFLSRPDAAESPLAQPLRQYRFVPIEPPSNLMELGSLYYVDAAAMEFTAICHPLPEDLKGRVVESPGGTLRTNLERTGRLATDSTVDFRAAASGDVDMNYEHRVEVSLTDVRLFELPLGDADLIFAKLMSRPECDKVATRHMRAGRYVCQGQKILSATAEYQLDREARRQLTTKGKVSTDRINGLVKGAVEARSEHGVVEREGRLFSGAALKYGVKMEPTCLAPPEAYFSRTLPRTAFGRMTNFVLFRIVEPMLPAKETRVATAQLTTD